MTQELVSPTDGEVPNPADLRVEIARKRVRQYLVAEKIGVSESHLSRILSGRKPLTVELDKAIRLAILEVAS